MSLNTFLLSVFAVTLALMNGYEFRFAVFVMSYAFMQLIEYLIWSHGLSNKKTNKILSFAGAMLLLLQPLAAILLLDDSPVRRGLLAAYAVFIVLHFLSSNSSDFRTTVAKNGHLHWHFMTPGVYSLTFCIYMALLLIPFVILTKYHPILYFGLATLIFSIATFAQSQTWGSMWCWMLNFLSVMIIIRIVFWEHFVKWCTKN